MTLADIAFEDFFGAYMSKTGVAVLGGKRVVVRIVAVRLPSDKSRLEPVCVRLRGRSPDEPGLLVFPDGEYKGVPLSYGEPEVYPRLVE